MIHPHRSPAHVLRSQFRQCGFKLGWDRGVFSPTSLTSKLTSLRDVSFKTAKCCLLSAVSAQIFARKYAFCSIFQNLPDSQAEFLDSLVSRIFLTPQRKGRKVEGGAKLNPQSRRGCKATPATLRGVQSYPCKVEGGARLPPQRRGGCKATPAGFSRKWYRNGQFDAMLTSFENMHTFSLVVIL